MSEENKNEVVEETVESTETTEAPVEVTEEVVEEQIQNIEPNNNEVAKEQVQIAPEVPKKRFRIINIILILITLFIVVVFILFMKTSITNFNLVKQKKEPNGYIEKIECEKDYKEYIYYKYTLFKIEIAKSDKDTSYSLIPAFQKDACQEVK